MYVLHRKCFSNLVYPSIWKSTAKILCSQFGLKIFLCVIWHILQLSKNFNQFHKNLFWREWSNNYTSKSNPPFDREKLTWRIDFEAFCKKKKRRRSCFRCDQFSIRGENWVSAGGWYEPGVDMNHSDRFFFFSRTLLPDPLYLSKWPNVFVEIVKCICLN